jgi:hypothetical protein
MHNLLKKSQSVSRMDIYRHNIIIAYMVVPGIGFGCKALCSIAGHSHKLKNIPLFLKLFS